MIRLTSRHRPADRFERERSLRRFSLTTLVILSLVAAPMASAQVFIFRDINPSQSNGDETDPDRASGGRVNGMASDPNDNETFFVATEWGGIYKSDDDGRNWVRQDGHNPNATWDVEVNPDNSTFDWVYATSLYDGRVTSLAGINVSNNGGSTWLKPPSAVPPAGFCTTNAAQDEHSAFGISVDPDNNSNVYIGTNCGLAVSNDFGASWSFIDPDPGFRADWVIDVVVHHDGVIDLCGYAGHMRSEDAGASWSAPSADLPGGTCSIAASPDDEDVIFATVGANIYESDDGGASWTLLGTPDSKRQGRIPFVAVNDRSDEAFDLWYGDIRLYRGSCTSDPADGETHCPIAHIDDPGSDPPDGWAGPYTRDTGGHDDVGDIVFDTAVSVDACPQLYSGDGGVYYNTRNGDNCHSPRWEQPDTTPHALWLWALAGVDRPGDEVEEYLYFGNQDNGTFGAIFGGATWPSWNNNKCCDGFDFAAEDQNALYTVCCGSGRANKMYRGNPGLTSNPEINTYPDDGLLPGFTFPDIVDTWGPDKYVVLTRDCQHAEDTDGDGDIDDDDETPEGGCSGANEGDGGIYITEDITAGSIDWTELGDATEPYDAASRACAVKAAVDDDDIPTFYAQKGRCDGIGQDTLWRFVGTDPDGAWQQVNLPAPGVNIFAVDPTDPDRLFIGAYKGPGNVDMMLSSDGGVNWDALPELDDLMTDNGAFKLVNSIGPYSVTRFWGYPQPSLVAFDPEDPNILVAGGRDSGVFLSTDGGEQWVVVTDPHSTDDSLPHLPQPWFAYFDHEPADQVDMYIGTRGRGVWRVNFARPPIADANGPYTTVEGTDVPLDGTGSFDPAGGELTYEWDFDNDGAYDDATGPTPDFDPVGDGVGQDGVYPISLKVTNPGGFSDTDDSTVTVNNVAPAVSFTSDQPKDEGAPLTINGTVTDPGWLDPLTATVNWGDSTGTSALTGVLENEREDATLTFTASHEYGDNGIYRVEVCADDDDTQTCEWIDVTINNVSPAVAIDAGQVEEIDEGQFVSVLAHFSDPGWLDTYGSMISWGYSSWADNPALLAITHQGGPGEDPDNPDVGTVTGARQYGDNGVFTIEVAVTDDDGGTGYTPFDLTVNNLDPTAVIDEADTIDVCGSPFFIAHAGEDVNFSGRSTDPGSDDLDLSWDWDDGPPAPDVTTSYPVNNPVVGDDPGTPTWSPEVDPRDVTDTKIHAFGTACYYNVVFSVLDDDGGTASDVTDVVIQGNANIVRSSGYWYRNYRRQGRRFFTDEELQCFLDMVDHMSSVFAEITDASTLDDAEEALDPSHSNGDIRVQFDRQLLAVWLNFANGALEHDELVDTNSDNVPDTPLLEVLCAAEQARIADLVTPNDGVIENWKDILEKINLVDET